MIFLHMNYDVITDKFVSETIDFQLIIINYLGHILRVFHGWSFICYEEYGNWEIVENWDSFKFPIEIFQEQKLKDTEKYIICS